MLVFVISLVVVQGSEGSASSHFHKENDSDQASCDASSGDLSFDTPT